jgi:hypothetical protein
MGGCTRVPARAGRAGERGASSGERWSRRGSGAHGRRGCGGSGRRWISAPRTAAKARRARHARQRRRRASSAPPERFTQRKRRGRRECRSFSASSPSASGSSACVPPTSLLAPPSRGCRNPHPHGPVILREPPRRSLPLQDLWRRPKDLAGRTVGLDLRHRTCLAEAERRSFGRAQAVDLLRVARVRSLRMTDLGPAKWFGNTLSTVRGWMRTRGSAPGRTPPASAA